MVNVKIEVRIACFGKIEKGAINAARKLVVIEALVATRIELFILLIS